MKLMVDHQKSQPKRKPKYSHSQKGSGAQQPNEQEPSFTFLGALGKVSSFNNENLQINAREQCNIGPSCPARQIQVAGSPAAAVDILDLPEVSRDF